LEQAVEFLKALRAHFRRPLLIIWDNSKPHRSIPVRDYVASTAGQIQLHFLPGLRTRAQSRRIPLELALANFCADNFAELRHTTRGKLKSAQHRSVIIASCWQQADLF
jgi:hypothetical protein